MRAPDEEKNAKIKETYAATLRRRKSQTCKVFTVKVQKNKLNKAQAENLKMMFVEAKWMYNHILSISNEGADVFSLKYADIPEIKHYDKDKKEIVSKVQWLSAQQRRAVIDGIQNSIRGLSAIKANGGKVGALKFISEYRSLDLSQANVTYKLVGKNKIKIQGIKKPVKVNGLEQILRLPEYELANAKLLNRNGDYYVAITTYVPREKKKEPKPLLGIDFGCQTTITTSDGDKRTLRVEETERIKNLRRKIECSMKGSNNRWELRLKLRKECRRQRNRKDDWANKLCHELAKYQIVMQDEQVVEWQENGHGKAVTDGALGRIKRRLTERDDTVVLSKWCPTTKLCTCCGKKLEMSQWDRTFKCPRCGHVEDRDVHAAKNMLWFYNNKVGVGRTSTPDEIATELGQIFQSSSLSSQEAAKSLDWR